ncbi:phosphatase PAP2 family protein [Roseivirga sp.]|uniref:phosphatase PAP2 family protein n=1 Tax=Roseivirga sp. TaxID=1964215 RepID=UPI003B5211C5
MIKKLKLIPIFLILLALGACDKELPTYLPYESFEYSTMDANGGTWTPVLLNAGSDIAIPAPADVSSAAYLAELADVEMQISEMTDSEREALAYWTDNPGIRWNEIALELIAKYNLIPGPNDDGSYTLPNPNNPDGPPPFPFAHPPYAVRALAYMSVAQFDGMISAWHHKFNYNRPAAFTQSQSIDYAYTDNNIPAYPSEGAVIAESSRRVLTAMFPLEAEYLQEKADEHLNSILLSGGYVSSDIEAGQLIGEEVATLALNRAAQDGMSKAQTPKRVSDSIANAAMERFGWMWINQELPQRPVGLTPLYGELEMWSVPDVELTRVAPPPAIGSDEYLQDIELLKYYADNMTEEWRAIANFWQDGLGTYTPPGHWNDIANRYLVGYRQNPLRTARIYAYLNMAMMDAGISCWDSKYYYHYPRPIQQIEGFETIAGTPNFPSYTSGHSVFSAAAAEILAYVFPPEATKFRAWAEEAAISRVYGGIHWTFDATVGTDQGIDVANYTLARAQSDGAN